MPPELTTVMEWNAPGVTGNDCPSCSYFDGVAAQYQGNPVILRKVDKWRVQHAEWDQCTNPRGGADE